MELNPLIKSTINVRPIYLENLVLFLCLTFLFCFVVFTLWLSVARILLEMMTLGFREESYSLV